MDDMLKMVAGLVVRHCVTAMGALLVQYSLIAPTDKTSWIQTTTGIVLGALGIFWSWWQKSGQQAVLAKFAKMKGAAPPSATTAEAAKIATEAVKVASLVLLAVVLAAAVTAPAFAQGGTFGNKPAALKLPIDPLGLNNKVGTGSPLHDLLGALDAKLLPDLQYALKLAQASGSKVTAPCYQAWIDLIQTRQSAVKDGDNAIPMPDPHLVTDFEKLVELRNSLQPDSPFMISCSPVASMVKKDILGFIGTVIGGGAGLATLVPGL